MLNHLLVTVNSIYLNNKTIKEYPYSGVDEKFIEYININKISKEQILFIDRFNSGVHLVILIYYFD